MISPDNRLNSSYPDEDENSIPQTESSLPREKSNELEKETTIEERIRASREKNVPDEFIFNKIKELPQYKKSLGNGVPESELNSYVKEKYGLKFDEQKKENGFRDAWQTALKHSSLADILETTAGKNAISNNIREIKQSLYNTPIAATLSAPRGLVEFPGNVAEAGKEHRKNIPEEEHDLFEKYVIDNVLEFFDNALKYTGIKPLAQTYLPNFEEAKQLVSPGEEEKKTIGGQLTERVVGSAIQGAETGYLGGPAGAIYGGVTGAVIGVGDYLMELTGISPEKRSLLPLFIGKRPTKTIHGELLPPEHLPVPGGPRYHIDNINELAAKVASGSKENLNMPALRAAYDLNIPIQELPLQVIYNGGLPNLVEGIAQNSILGHNRFNRLIEDFTSDMTTRVNEVIDSVPIDTLGQITTIEDIGEPQFTNTLPQLLSIAAPALNVPEHVSGAIGKSAIKKYDEDITAQYEALYDSVSFKPDDVIKPESPEYQALENIVYSVEKEFESKGFKGNERKEGLRVIKELKSLFSTKSTNFDLVLGKKNRIKQDISLEDLNKNRKDLNKKISYEFPTLVNLLEPIQKEIRRVFYNAAETRPHIKPIIEANKLFGEKKELLNDPITKTLYAKTDEDFYKSVKNKPSMLKKFKEVAEKTGQVQAYNDLKSRIIADILEKPLAATTPLEFVKSINKGLIRQVRELEPIFTEFQGLSQALQKQQKITAPLTSKVESNRNRIRHLILEDILSDSDFTQTLQQMNNPLGLELVREVLKATPQGKSLLKTLEKKKVEQLIYNGPRKQEITLSDLSKVFENDKTNILMKKLLSPENYKQAKALSVLAKGFEKGVEKGLNIKKHAIKGAGFGVLGALYFNPITAVVGVGLLATYLTKSNFKSNLIKHIENQYKSRNAPLNVSKTQNSKNNSSNHNTPPNP